MCITPIHVLHLSSLSPCPHIRSYKHWSGLQAQPPLLGVCSHWVVRVKPYFGFFIFKRQMVSPTRAAGRGDGAVPHVCSPWHSPAQPQQKPEPQFLSNWRHLWHLILLFPIECFSEPLNATRQQVSVKKPNCKV